jgi:hypothetical protein
MRIETIDELERIAKVYAASGMMPRGLDTAAKVAVCIQAGAELGLAPFQSTQAIAIVNGRPTLWGDALLAVVRASPLCEWIREMPSVDESGKVTGYACTTQRRGEPEPVTRRFTLDDAKNAGLAGKSGPWRDYPARMLQMRARAFCLRDVYADLLRGIGCAEEVQDYRTDAPAHPSPAAPKKMTVPVEMPVPTADGFTMADAAIDEDKLPDDATDFDAGALEEKLRESMYADIMALAQAKGLEKINSALRVVEFQSGLAPKSLKIKKDMQYSLLSQLHSALEGSRAAEGKLRESMYADIMALEQSKGPERINSALRVLEFQKGLAPKSLKVKKDMQYSLLYQLHSALEWSLAAMKNEAAQHPVVG